MSRVRSFNEDGLFRNFLHKYGLPNRIFLGKNKKRDVRGGETKNWIGKCSNNDDIGSFHLVDLIITELKVENLFVKKNSFTRFALQSELCNFNQ